MGLSREEMTALTLMHGSAVVKRRPTTEHRPSGCYARCPHCRLTSDLEKVERDVFLIGCWRCYHGFLLDWSQVDDS